MGSKALEEWTKYCRKTTAVNARFSEKPRKVTFTHPGLNYLALDPAGNLDTVSLLRFVDDIDNFAYSSPDVWRRLIDSGLTFMVALEYKISRTMHLKHIPKYPVDCEVSYFGAGNSSFNQQVLVFLPGFREPVMSQVSKLVHIDSETRRPKLLPDWYKDSIGVRGGRMQDLQIERFPRPAETFMAQVRVTWSDIDSNNHTNFLSYVKYGIDTLKTAMYVENSTSKTNLLASKQMKSQFSANAVHSNREPLKWMTKDIVKNGVEKMSICYFSECLEGDLLNVHLWQEKGEELAVRCSVESLDQTPLCQFVTKFYGPNHHL